jgi:Zn finger protein HypA/HybF involved in hydrogenase expression
MYIREGKMYCKSCQKSLDDTEIRSNQKYIDIDNRTLCPECHLKSYIRGDIDEEIKEDNVDIS